MILWLPGIVMDSLAKQRREAPLLAPLACPVSIPCTFTNSPRASGSALTPDLLMSRRGIGHISSRVVIAGGHARVCGGGVRMEAPQQQCHSEERQNDSGADNLAQLFRGAHDLSFLSPIRADSVSRPQWPKGAFNASAP